MADVEARLDETPAAVPNAAGADDSFAYIVADRRAREIPPDDARDAVRGDGSLLWLHLHGPDETAAAWLALKGDVPDAALGALVAAETRPRCEPIADGALVNLRGVGDAAIGSGDPLNSIRLWMQDGRVVSSHALADAALRQAGRSRRVAAR